MSEPIRMPLPKLGRLYQKAVLNAARSKMSSGGSLQALPEQPVLVEHPGVTEDQAEQYRLLFAGEPFDGSHRRALPSVLLHIAGFPVQMALLSRDDFPLPLMGMVHLSNEVSHHQPVQAGTPLQVLARAENFAPHRRGTQVDIVVEVYPQAADVTTASPQDRLYTSTSRYLGLGTFLYSTTDAASEVRQEFTPPPKTGLWTLAADTGRRYAAVSGDFNPIHLSSLTGKALGQQGAIVHGMYLAARMLEGREPETAGHRWSISFAAPVGLPGKVAFAVERLSDATQKFVGWNPRNRRQHFTGALTLPQQSQAP